MGVDPFLVAASLKAIVAQRLVRRICEHCVEPARPDGDEQQLLDVAGKQHPVGDAQFRRGRGCPHCYNTGFRGRVGVFELLELDRDMGSALRDGDVSAFNQAAYRRADFLPLSYGALELAKQGVTSLSEVLRVSAMVEDEVLGAAVGELNL